MRFQQDLVELVSLSIQKADLWKRASAALFDVIMLGILVVGFALLFSKIVGYDKRIEKKISLG